MIEIVAPVLAGAFVYIWCMVLMAAAIGRFCPSVIRHNSMGKLIPLFWPLLVPLFLAAVAVFGVIEVAVQTGERERAIAERADRSRQGGAE